MHIVCEQNAASGLITVVALPSGAAERAVIGLKLTLAQTRVAVPESILRCPVPDTAAETKPGGALVNADLKVVDLSQTLLLTGRNGCVAERRGTMRPPDPAGHGVPVIREAFAERRGVVIDGTRAPTSRLEVKVIDRSNRRCCSIRSSRGAALGRRARPP